MKNYWMDEFTVANNAVMRLMTPTPILLSVAWAGFANIATMNRTDEGQLYRPYITRTDGSFLLDSCVVY